MQTESHDRGALIDWRARYADLESQMAQMVELVARRYRELQQQNVTSGNAGGLRVNIEAVEVEPAGSGKVFATAICEGRDLEFALYEYFQGIKVSSQRYQRSNTFTIAGAGSRVDRIRVFARNRGKSAVMDTRSIILRKE